jgi:alpha-L-arabinofuranosidase
MRSSVVALALLGLPFFAGAAALKARLEVGTRDPGIAVSPMHYGIFFEEINRAGDGGIYAEMLQNRSFEDNAQSASAWSASGGLKVFLDSSKPLNAANPQALRLEFGPSGGALSNAGFSKEAQKGKTPAFEGGLGLSKGVALKFTAYLRGSADMKVQLRDEKGKVLAESGLAAAGEDWSKVEATLLPSRSSSKGRLSVVGTGPGTAWIDQVSLMPAETWKGHGLRKDLAGLVEAMHPGFIRFPGGCFVEGNNKEEAIKWKDSIGDPASRKGTWNLWGYRTTGGFGVHEFLQWCEDLGAEPLYVINCGMGHGYALPMGREMDEKVQDALDLLEYARGPRSSRWGALRAAAGHPEPFRLRYIEIGNENGGKEYEERHALMADAIRKAWPDVKIVTDNWGGLPKSRQLDLVDEHYYLNPEAMAGMASHYDGYDRKGPKIYVGEYAVTQDCGMGNLKAAVAEAAFMCGMERNADVVRMSSYAPLFVHPAWRAWNPNAIVFDQSRAYGTPSYHVQALFASNRPQVALPITVEQPQAPYAPPRGYFGLASWGTQVQYKDFRFTGPDGKPVFEGDFSGGLKGWKVHKGDWKAEGGVLSQRSLEDDCLIYVEKSRWADGTLSLKAKKIAGREGFQIMFQADDLKAHRFWNLGGWGNTVHCIEADSAQPKVPGSVETGRWYEIKIELQGPKVSCYLDGKLLQEILRRGPQAVYASAGRSEGGKELIIKTANVSAKEVEAEFNLPGVKMGGEARAWTLSSGDPGDENSFEQPLKVAPRAQSFKAPGPRLLRKLPPHSVELLRLELETQAGNP